MSESIPEIQAHHTLLKPLITSEQIVNNILSYYDIQDYPIDEQVIVFLSVKGKITPDRTQEEWRKAPWHDEPFDLNDRDVSTKMIEWYVNCPIDQYDHYHSVNAFKSRSKAEGDDCSNIFDGRVLHVESDEVTNGVFKSLNLLPTYEVESSPGHHYHFFELNRAIPAKKLKELNKRLTTVSGKRGIDGFEVSKVLRDPLSHNLKPIYRKDGESPIVSEMRKIGDRWSLEDLERALSLAEDAKRFREGKSNAQDTISLDFQEQLIPNISSDAWDAKVKEYRNKGLHETHLHSLYGGADDRSEAEYAVDCELLKLGIQPFEIAQIIKASPLNKYSGRSDEDRRILGTISKAANNPDVKAAINASSKTSTDFTLSYHTGEELLSKPAPAAEWAVNGFLEIGTCMMIAADGGTGKSFTFMDMLLDISQGNRWLAHPECKNMHVDDFTICLGGRQTKKCKVVYFNQDTGRNEFHRRLEKLAKARNGGLKDIFIVDMPIDLTDKVHKNEIRGFLKSLSADGSQVVVVFDTFTSCSGDIDENIVKEVKPVISYLAEDLSHRDGHTVVVLHHTQKNGNKFRGSSHLKNAVDSVVNLERAGGVSRISVEKNRCETISPFMFTLVREGNSAYFVESLETPKEAKGSNIEDVVKVILADGEFNQKQMIDKVQQKVPSAGKDAVKAILKQLEQQKVIKTRGGARKSTIYALV